MMHKEQIKRFVAESNQIEGILGPPSESDMLAHELFFSLDRLRIDDVCSFVSMVAGAQIRDTYGLDVRIGNLPSRGGPEIRAWLKVFTHEVNRGFIDSYDAHCQYETLHPFTDGNGRSGRAIWAWQEIQAGRWSSIGRGFLHTWYYQTLERLTERQTSEARQTIDLKPMKVKP